MVGFKYSQMHKSWSRQACVPAYMYWTSWYYFMYPKQRICFLTFLNSPPCWPLDFSLDWSLFCFGDPIKTKKYSVKNGYQYLTNDTGNMLPFFLVASGGWEGRWFHRKFYFCTVSLKHALKLFINLDLHRWIFSDWRHIVNVTLTRYLLCAPLIK